MTAFVRSWLVMASVALLSSGSWAQAPQFDGFTPGWGVQYNAGHQRSYAAPGPEYQELPDDRGPWHKFDEQVALNFKDLVADSWVRVEYLQGNFQRPGGALLGAPLVNVPNPNLPFEVAAGPLVGARALVPSVSPLELRAQNGVRTTIGINSFRDFSLEASYVGLQDMRSGFQLVPTDLDPDIFPGAVRFYATSVLNAGVPGSTVILYDRLFEVDYKAQYWSGEVNVLFNDHTPAMGLRMRPLIGFRYNSYGEDLVQHGEFDNNSGVDPLLGTLANPIRNTILSTTQNTFYMGQIGFQAELVDKWYTIGVAPKLAVGSNQIRTHVLTQDLRDSQIIDLADDGITSLNKNTVILGTNIDLNAYLKVRVNSWLSLTGGAYYWWMPNVARAHDVIVYDDLGIDVPPAIRPQLKTHSMGVHGFTVGAEITF